MPDLTQYDPDIHDIQWIPNALNEQTTRLKQWQEIKHKTELIDEKIGKPEPIRVKMNEIYLNGNVPPE